MHEPNFFQSKLALAKAFPGRKLPMTKLHQLYRDIYARKPQRKMLSAIKDENKIGVFHGEVSIYNHKDMDKLIDKYMDFGDDMQYYVEALMNSESLTPSPKKKNVAIKSRIREASSVPPPSFDQNFTLTKFNIQKPSARENAPSNNPSYRTQGSTISYFDKSPSMETPSQKKINAKKWPKEIQALHDSIEKHTLNRSHRKLLNSSTEELQIKENLNDINSQIKIYFHRLGLDHQKSAMEEAKEISKYSKRTDTFETGSMRDTPTMMIKDEKSHLKDSNAFDKILPERTLSIFSKEKQPHRSETTSTDQGGERHLSVFSKARRTKRLSDIPSLEIPSVGNYLDKSKVADKSVVLPENINMSISQSHIQQYRPPRLLQNSQSVAGTPVNHYPSPLLSQTQSPTAITTGNFFLPKVAGRSQKATSISLSRPKNRKELNFTSKNDINKLFDSCLQVQDNITSMDKKLDNDGKRVNKKLSKLDIKLQRVMKVNFLPQEFIFDDQI